MQKKMGTVRGGRVGIVAPSDVYSELTKSKSGASILLSGILAVDSLSSSEISLRAHSGGLSVFGEELLITVFQNKTIEIKGKITEVKLKYGKL